MKKPPILLIHGACCNGESWGEFAKQFRKYGFEVHTPTLRHHGVFETKAVLIENAKKLNKVGLQDYLSDLEKIVDNMAVAPIIIGHSMGGLLAQLLAGRCKNQGVVLLAPAPAAGIFSFYPTQMQFWIPYFWTAILKKPMFPSSEKKWGKFICNAQSEEIRKEVYKTMCAESGKAYFEICLWFLDRKRASYVNYKAVQSPILILVGSEDKCTGSKIARVTAKKYGSQARYIEIQGSDHMLMMGEHMPRVLECFHEWIRDI